jgi:hypothetical protein
MATRQQSLFFAELFSHLCLLCGRYGRLDYLYLNAGILPVVQGQFYWDTLMTTNIKHILHVLATCMWRLRAAFCLDGGKLLQVRRPCLPLTSRDPLKLS